MDMKQRFVHLAGVQLVVELVIVLVFQVGRFSRPGRIDIVDDIVLFGLHLFAVFPFLLFAKHNLHGQELAVFLQQALNRSVLQILLKLVTDMQYDIRSALGLDGILHRVFRIAGTCPMHRLGVFPITEREDLHLVTNHKGGIKSQTKMTNDGFRFVFVLVQKFFRTGEGNLVDVLIHLFCTHADTMILNRQGLLIFIYKYAYARVAQIALGFAYAGQCFEFLRGIHGIRNQLTKKNLMVAVQKFLNHGENVIRRYPNRSFCHNCI